MGTNLRLLIAEDTEDDAELLLRELQRGGYVPDALRVDTEAAFKQALAEREWDIVVADYAMPAFSGPRVLEILRDSGKDVPVLIVSGTVGEAVALETMKAGANDYLMKGSLRRLVPAIEREMREAKGRAERRRAEEALQSSENRFRILCESSPLGIFLQNSATEYLYVNRRWQEITGQYSEKPGRDCLTENVHPEDGDALRIAWEMFRLGEGDFEYDYRLTRPSGEVRWVCVRIARLQEGESVSGYVGTLEDITERRSAQEQLLQAQKLESLGRLAGGVAHDFNNVLTAIMGYTDLALLDAPEGSPLQRYLNNVRVAGERASSLTGQLLAFARKQIIVPKIISLNDLILETDPLLRRLIGEHIFLNTIPKPNIWPVKADRGQCQQILINLAINARDAMPQGGKLTVETDNVTLDGDSQRFHADITPGDYVMMAVSDTGFGIDVETQKHIFEPFFTTKEPGRGTGLGLATCYGIVKQAGGHIWLYSEPGKGATFKIYLPRVQEAISQTEIESKSVLSGEETILIAEDDPLLRTFIKETLTAQGYRVLDAANGEEALEKARAAGGVIDLLLTDMVMPSLGGSDLTTTLRAEQPSLRIVQMSGYTDNALIAQNAASVETNYIQKPFGSGALLRAVRAALDKKSASS